MAYFQVGTRLLKEYPEVSCRTFTGQRTSLIIAIAHDPASARIEKEETK
jgi:hypothetical protein